MASTALSPPGKPPTVVRLDPLTGHDEAFFAQGSAAPDVVALIARIAHGPDGAALDLPAFGASEVDRLVAALYTSLYGDQAECRLRCRSCGDDYEFTLALSALIATQDAERPSPPEDGWWRLDEGCEVRAPMLADLADAPDPAALAARLSRGPACDPEAIAAFLDRAAPLLSVDLAAACPHCGQTESLRFDLAAYLAARLSSEKPFLIRETHLIAARYGWSHSEIMALTREDRRAYAGLVEAERAAAQRGQRRLA
jgi:hypothetical protein